MSTPNTEQQEFWNGEAGRRWAAAQEALDRALEPFGKAVLSKAAPRTGERVIDVGCGCGATTLLAGEAVGASGGALGLDLSGQMLEVARARTSSAHVRFEKADVALYQPERKADLLVSRFGVMFFADPTQAFSNMRAMLRPDGRLVFVCWRPLKENPWMALPAQAAAPLFPPPAPADPLAPGPFAFADKERVRGILHAAGYRNISIDPFDAEVIVARPSGGVEEALAFALTLGPVARMVDGAAPELCARAADAIRAALKPHVTPDGIRLAGATWVVSATA